MKTWLRITVTVFAGLAVGAGGAWFRIQNGLNGGRLQNGPWSTAFNYGTAKTDAATRAAVALRGILALPSSEVLYWNASTDSDGRALNGSCTYAMTGLPLNARWWSVTYYNKAGFLVANPANIWSFGSASLNTAGPKGWLVTIAPSRPEGDEHWLPSEDGKGFELTLRMYIGGAQFRFAPSSQKLPTLERVTCG